MKHWNHKHGGVRTKEYRAWSHAKGRCYNPKDPRFRLYGANGVKMCDRWVNDFSAFINDMGKAPSPKHTLERVDRKGDYTPENCIWATRTVQANNTRCNTIIEGGMTMAQFARHHGLNYNSFCHYYIGRSLPLEIAIENATKLGEKRKSGQRRLYTCPDLFRSRSEATKKAWAAGRYANRGKKKSA